MLMFWNCGNGRSSCARVVVALLPSAVPANAGLPKNGFGTVWFSTVVPSARYFGSSWLMFTARVDRAAERQVIAARADVADRHRDAAAELALHVRPGTLLHARRGAVLIDEVDAGADARRRAE